MRASSLFVAIAAIAIGTPAAAARPVASLPVSKGFWILSTDRCATATNGQAYDGARWGQIYYYGEGASLGPVGEMEPIVKTTALKDGFTDLSFPDAGGLGYFRIKSLGGDRAIWRVGAPSRDRFEILDDTLVRCDFAALSSKMQRAVRQFAPALAAQTSAAATTASSSQPSLPWEVQPISSGKAAIFSGSGLTKMIGLVCEADGGATFYTQLKTKARGTRLTATFHDDDGGQPQLVLDHVAQTDVWAGPASSAVIQSLFHGNAITVDFGTMGKDRISLAGSSKTIREALGPCLYTPASPPPPPAAPLGISPGYYVEEGSLCGDAIGVFYYDGRRYGMIYDRADERGIIGAVGKPSKSKNGWLMTDGSTVETMSSGRIKWSFEEGAAYRLCPAGAIEPSKRVR